MISLILDGDNGDDWRPTERSNPRPSGNEYDGTMIALMAQNIDTNEDDMAYDKRK